MGFITSKYATLKEEAITMQLQLKDLTQDVENRLVDEEHFEKYYTLEKENYIQLKDAVSQYEKAYIVSMRRYNSMKTKVDSIITASKAK
jgi:predicted  nucleic acid-binding Zn-ribbon protein